eukprot:COSAG02_NODE_62912_length_264_cov_1.242424_1_plen_21_part_10
MGCMYLFLMSQYFLGMECSQY